MKEQKTGTAGAWGEVQRCECIITYRHRADASGTGIQSEFLKGLSKTSWGVLWLSRPRELAPFGTNLIEWMEAEKKRGGGERGACSSWWGRNDCLDLLLKKRKKEKKVIIYHFLPSYTKDIVVFSGTFNTNYASQKLYDTNKVLTEWINDYEETPTQSGRQLERVTHTEECVINSFTNTKEKECNIL